MRSSVQMLFHVLKSTAVGIQPINAIRNAAPAAVSKSHSGHSTAGRASGGEATLSTTATTVDSTSTLARNLTSLSNVLNLPTSKRAVVATNSPTATHVVEAVPAAAEIPSKASRNAAVTSPTAATTKKPVARPVAR